MLGWERAPATLGTATYVLHSLRCSQPATLSCLGTRARPPPFSASASAPQEPLRDRLCQPVLLQPGGGPVRGVGAVFLSIMYLTVGGGALQGCASELCMTRAWPRARSLESGMSCVRPLCWLTRRCKPHRPHGIACPAGKQQAAVLTSRAFLGNPSNSPCHLFLLLLPCFLTHLGNALRVTVRNALLAPFAGPRFPGQPRHAPD